MDNPDEIAKATADAAEAEGKPAATGLGKFKDVKTLLDAYNSLEAEFTRRSQRLKELEKANKVEEKPDGEISQPSPLSDDALVGATLGNARVRDAVIGEYLKNVSLPQSVPLVTGGGGVAAPRLAPKSVKEAGLLAKEFLGRR